MLMKKFVLFLGLMIASLALNIWANDGTYYTSGNQLVPLQETDISVRKEVLTISILNNGFARVDVYYEFWNPGQQSRQLLMGFEADPPYNSDWKFHPDGVHPNIADFTVEMNGIQLAYKNAVCVYNAATLDTVSRKDYVLFDDNRIYEKDPETNPEYWDAGITFDYVYYFTATFQPGINKVHHTYRYQMSKGLGNPWDICYKLSPASRWANHQIDDFTLIVRADNTAKHFVIDQKAFPQADFSVIEGVGKIRNLPIEKSWQTPHLEFALRNGAVQTHITNFKPQDELRIASGYDYGKPFGHYYDPYYGQIPFLMTIWDAELKHHDLQFLKRVSRNLPYAYRGHVFKDKVMREFFESQWWYMPDPNYKDDDSDFTEVDHLYIKAEID